MLIAEHLLDTYVPVMLKPWSAEGAVVAPPAALLAPTYDAGDRPQPQWDLEQLRALAESRRAILAPGTFESQDEELALRILASQVPTVTATCLLVLHLLPPGQSLTRESVAEAEQRHERIIACGARHVLLNPPLEPQQLRSSVDLAVATAETQAARSQSVLGPVDANAQQVGRAEEQLFDILWNQIPRALMPSFPPVDPLLHEVPGKWVGSYRFVYRFPTHGQKIYEAVDVNQSGSDSCVVKVIAKREVQSSAALESIYREFVLVSTTLDHPHIVKWHACLHTSSYLYLMLDFAGQVNLQVHTDHQPGQRLEAEVALDLWGQIVSAVAHCHSQQIAHRDLALRHVALMPSQEAPGGLWCRLLDFRSAVICGRGSSRMRCGDLPYIAPEVLAEEDYLPVCADRWSVGVALLEMAGGLSTLERLLHWPLGRPPHSDAETARQLREVFGQEDIHGRALALSGGVRNETVEAKLRSLLQPIPAQRQPVESFL